MGSPLPANISKLIRSCPACHAIYRADFARCPIDGDALAKSDVDPLIGRTLGQHYVIDELIGEGAMARVYRAHHGLLELKQFAVKVMLGDLAATLEMRLRFAQEADTASRLDHPNVVSVVDFGRSETGLMFMVMELVAGKTLADTIAAEGQLSPRRSLAIARQIAQGLQHAHERGLVHRDLKPENVVLSGTPEAARIVDFGIALAPEDERTTRLTTVGLAMGTPIYAAPEQTHNEPIDHRADLFALGITLYEMLAGKPPFDGGMLEIIRHNASDVTPLIEGQGGARVPPMIEDIVRRLMRREPDARYADAAALIAAIDAALDAPSRVVALPMLATLHSLDVELPPLVKPKSLRLRALLGVALIGGLAFGVHALLVRDDRPATSAATAPATAPAIAPARVQEPPAVPAPAQPTGSEPAPAPPQATKEAPHEQIVLPKRPAPLAPSAQRPITTIAGAAAARAILPSKGHAAPAADPPISDEVGSGGPTSAIQPPAAPAVVPITTEQPQKAVEPPPDESTEEPQASDDAL